jgi:hypothetical protein
MSGLERLSRSLVSVGKGLEAKSQSREGGPISIQLKSKGVVSSKKVHTDVPNQEGRGEVTKDKEFEIKCISSLRSYHQ